MTYLISVFSVYTKLETLSDKLEESDEGYYDLILMDIQMPILNGYDTTAKILPFLLSC